MEAKTMTTTTTTTATKQQRPFSIAVPLGTDQPYRAAWPGGWSDVRKRLREWADEDAKRRREWVLSIVRECARIGAAEIIWLAPWGVPEGSYVPAGQMERLRVEDIGRFDDIRAANDLAAELGIARRTVFEGIGRQASTLRRWLTLGSVKWVYPRFSNLNERAIFDRHVIAAKEANCTGVAIDSMAAADRLYGEALRWWEIARLSGMELAGEGYMPTAPVDWMLWAWQIQQTNLSSRWPRFHHDRCVISGHTAGVEDPVSAVRLGREMEGRGWWCVYSCHSVEWVGEVGKALGTGQ